MTIKKVILASQSPQRQQMLASLHVDFEAIPADIDELAIQHPDFKIRAHKVAEGKARKIIASHSEAIVLAADTFVLSSSGVTLEKPADLAEAKKMLRMLSGSSFTEVTGCFYYDGVSKTEAKSSVVTMAKFRKLTESEIEQFVTTEPVTTWSGAFCPAYPTSVALLESVNGSLSSFTHGFPVEFFQPLLAKSGVFSKK